MSYGRNQCEELHSEILDYFTSDVNKILYKCHGNANIVFAINNDKVIRAPKLYGNYNYTDRLSEEKLKFFIDYTKLLKKFIKTADIPDVKLGHLKNNVLIHLNKILNHRFSSLSSLSASSLSSFISKESNTDHKNTKYLIGPYVFLCDDATKLKANFFPMANTKTYSIEIKPKQGWKIQGFSNIINLFNNNVKNTSKCRYNAMQYTKLKNNKIKQLSEYCPLDLFSGNILRMKRAIRNLIKNPQNNFRIFIDGDLKNCENSSLQNVIEENFNGSVDLLVDIIVRCLLNDNTNDVTGDRNYENNQCDMEITTTKNCDSQSTLNKNCILSEILFLQKLAMQNMDKMNSDINLNEKTYTYLESMIKKENNGRIENLTSTEQYMIGATMLDCSIMITFKIVEKLENFCPTPKLNCFEIDNKIVVYEINLLDLDPKPDNHFGKYVKVTNHAYLDAYEYEIMLGN